VAVLIFPILIRYTEKKNILDIPGHRRIHTRLTPSIGGVAIFFGFLTSCIVWMELMSWPGLKSIFGILFIMFVLGLCDDLVHVKPSVKITGQLLAGSLAFFLLDVQLTSTYGLFGVHRLPWIISYAITLFTIVIITNSFNLIDGIDGLAGAFSTVCLIFYGTWFYLTGDANISILCFALSGSTLGFLIFNWEPSKIFMGDTGALVIGMVLSMLTIRFINTNHELAHTSTLKFSSSISAAICVLCIPLVDTSRIIILRLRRGISPLKADKRHIHHYLVRLGLHHKHAVVLLVFVHFIYLSLAIVFNKFSDSYFIPVLIGFSVFLCFVLDRFMVRKLN
jgi:UDP-GlcNAc:undecaprenyl-phosphate GlcNAc-1-phosphate transferase